jgi:hypothetical protein
VFKSFFTSGYELSGVSVSFENSVLRLNTNTTELNLGSDSSLLTANLAVNLLGEINKNLSVEDSVFVQVHELRSTRGTGFLFLLLLDVFLCSRLSGFGKFLLPRFVEFINLGLVGFEVSATAATHLLESFILLLELSDKLVSSRLVNNGLVLNFFSTIGVLKGVESLFVIQISRSDSADHSSSRVSTKGILEHSSELRISVRDNHAFRGGSHAFLSEGGNDVTESR